MTRGGRGRGYQGKEGEGLSRSMCKGPVDKVSGRRELNVGGGVGRAEESNERKMGTSVIEQE